MAESDSSNLEFGRVLDGKTSDRKVWFLIVPAVAGLAALIVFAGLAISNSSGLESKVRLAEQQAQEAQKAVEQRDDLLKKARADEAVLRSPGQGAAVMAAAIPGSPASGVALVHPDQTAMKLYAFGLEHPQAGQEYRVEAIGPEKQRTVVGRIVPDDRGTAFLLAKNVPKGATGVEVVLAAVQGGGEGGAAKGAENAPAADTAAGGATEGEASGTLVMAGLFPKQGTVGVVAAPDLSDRAQGRAPPASSRRPRR
jgi:hypothetical protein